MDDNAVEAVVYEDQQAAEQLGEQFHRSSLRSDAVLSDRPSAEESLRKDEPVTQRKIPHRPTSTAAARGSASASAKEVRSIQHRAAEHDGRIVSIGPLVLFSTDTGDAWILDPADQLAARLASDGDPLPVYIEETDTNYAIGWQGRYRIDGDPSSTKTTNRVASSPSKVIRSSHSFVSSAK